MFIAVKETVYFTEVKGAAGLSQPANACTLLIYPTRQTEKEIRITGVYLPQPPTALVTTEWVEPLTDLQNQSYMADGGMVSHLIGGDFNQHTWRGGNDIEYQVWLLNSGMWELSNPERATYRTGSALDKFLLLPGQCLPGNFFPADLTIGLGGEYAEQEAVYPADTVPFQCAADHHPALLMLPGVEEEITDLRRTLRVSTLNELEWKEKNEEMAAYLKKNEDEWKRIVKKTKCNTNVPLHQPGSHNGSQGSIHQNAGKEKGSVAL